MFPSIPFLSNSTRRKPDHDMIAMLTVKPGTVIHLARAKLGSDGGKGVTGLLDTIPLTTSPKKGSERKRANCGMGLPFEGKLYDQIDITNFVDLDKYQFMMSLNKSIPVNKISTILDADLPAKVSLSGKLGTLGAKGFKFAPIGRVGFNLRLLDLGASDTRQKGYLRFKASARTDGRVDHGFEIDRKAEVFPSMPQTMLYGNVMYKTSNRNVNDEWKTVSSFGFHQDMRLLGVKFAARAGLTPEGKFVFDLKP